MLDQYVKWLLSAHCLLKHHYYYGETVARQFVFMDDMAGVDNKLIG